MFANKVRVTLLIFGISLAVCLFTYINIQYSHAFNLLQKSYSYIDEKSIIISGDISYEDIYNLQEILSEDISISAYQSPLQLKIDGFEKIEAYGLIVNNHFTENLIPDLIMDGAVYKPQIKWGRTFNTFEKLGFNKAIIITESLAHYLFGTENCVNKKLNLNIKNEINEFMIVGVVYDSYSALNNYNSFRINNKNGYRTTIYFPQNTFSNIESDNYKYLVLHSSKYSLTNLAHELDNIYKSKYTVKSWFGVKDNYASDLKKYQNEFFITCLSISIISILILLGFMLFSIKERIIEIGIRKAVGASNIDIMMQFLLEFIITGLIGSLIGVFSAILIYDIQVYLYSHDFIYYTLYASISSIVFSFLISNSIIILISFIPALISFKIKISDALRFT